jgi:hypothetical protein
LDSPVTLTLSTTVHVYVVDAGTISLPLLLGVIVNAVPLHIVLVLLAITGVGLTVTVIVKLVPTQLPASPLVGVTVYTTVCAVFVVLVKV